VTESKEAAGKAASRLFKSEVSQNPGLVLFPGGRSPISFYKELAGDMLNWNEISIMATDDRVVPLDNVHSNTGMIQREFIDQINQSSKPQLIKTFPENELNTRDALAAIKQRLINNVPRIAVLGMGSDGHTAGIFSENNMEQYCYHFKQSYDPFERVTISMDIFLKIPRLIFLIFGKEKKEMLSKVLSAQSMEDNTPTIFLLKNGKGTKTIICDTQAAPDGFPIGETEVIV